MTSDMSRLRGLGFTAAVALINETPTAKFPFLLSRVLGRLHLKAERVFSADEEAQLGELFGFSGGLRSELSLPLRRHPLEPRVGALSPPYLEARHLLVPH